MASEIETYQAYLLRFWRRDGTQPWRVTVYCVETQRPHHFASLDEALAFVRSQLERGPSPQSSRDDS